MIYILLYCHGPSMFEEYRTRDILMVTTTPRNIVEYVKRESSLYNYEIDIYQDGSDKDPKTVEAAQFIKDHKE